MSGGKVYDAQRNRFVKRGPESDLKPGKSRRLSRIVKARKRHRKQARKYARSQD
jgi:hypothetical protein